MTTVELSLEQKEKYTDKLLTYMKNDIEKIGHKIDQVWFDFRIQNPGWYNENGEDTVKFKEIVDISDDDFDKIIKRCIANEYISGRNDHITLTRQGWARANSLEKAKLYKQGDTNTNSTNNYNFQGPVTLNNSQIGNNNNLKINIQNDLENIIKIIENANATMDEKESAKNLLLEFIKHPLITSIFGTAIKTFIKNHFGV